MGPGRSRKRPESHIPWYCSGSLTKGIFSKRLINLFETVLSIMQEARKNTPSYTGVPSVDQAVVTSGTFLTTPDWDFNMAKGKWQLKVHHQTPLADLKGAVWQPTNLAKVCGVKQSSDE